MKTKDGRGRALCGPAQLRLLPHEEMLACGAGRPKTRSSHARTMVEEIGGAERAQDGRFQMVALWHDRAWAPLRVFRRGDGATVVVFKVGDAV